MRGLRISICVANLRNQSAQQICAANLRNKGHIRPRSVSFYAMAHFFHAMAHCVHAMVPSWFPPRDGRERGSRQTCVRVRDARSRNRGSGVRGLSTPEISAMTSS